MQYHQRSDYQILNESTNFIDLKILSYSSISKVNRKRMMFKIQKYLNHREEVSDIYASLYHFCLYIFILMQEFDSKPGPIKEEL